MSTRRPIVQSSARHTLSRRAAMPSHALEALESRSLLDATLPVVYLMQMDKTASEEGENVARFGVKRTGSLAQPLTVTYRVGGSATPDVDFIGLTGTLTIPAGKKFASLPVVPIDDFTVDPNETVVIELVKNTGPAKYVINTTDNVSDKMTIFINDTDEQPTVRLKMPDREATEYGPNNGLIVVERTGPLELPLSVQIRVAGSANGDASKGALDFVAIPTVLNFAPGVDRYEIEIDAINDNALEGDEIVRITVLDGPDYDLDLSNRRLYSNTIRIVDRPLVTMFVIDPIATSEEGDNATFLFHRTGSTAQELRIKLNIGGTALEGNDYEDLARTIIFAPGESIARVEIIGLGTRFPEAFRTVTASVAAGPQYNVNTATNFGAIRIFDDSISPAS
jgi:hypothetical protein